MPLSIDGLPVGEAILDTGGAYELFLRESYGLELIGEVEVLAFGGLETVSLAGSFDYQVAGIDQRAEHAPVGLSTCECNGIGFPFFRQTGWVLALDFETVAASLVAAAPENAAHLRFEAPPTSLGAFDSAFLTLEVEAGDKHRALLGLVDTGTASTVMRRGLFDAPSSRFLPDRIDVRIARAELGTVAANVGLYDTEGLPDIIIGTDVMRAWGPRWYFTYEQRGGTVTVVPAGSESPGAPPG